MDNYLRILQPSAYTFGLVGTTGSGKTRFTCNIAAPGARPILQKSVGETNTTIQNRVIIFSANPALTQRLIVAVKPDPVFFGSRDLMELLREPLCTTIRQLGRKGAPNAGEAEDCLREALRDPLQMEDFGLRRRLALLTTEQQENLVDGILQWFRDSAFYQYIEELYGRAVTELKSRGEEPSKNSAKLRNGLRTQVEARIDLLTREGGTQALLVLCQQTEQVLKERFFRVFQPERRSEDGYYYLNLALAEPDQDAADAFFSNNTKGHPSLESLCREIVIYVPIEEKIQKRLEAYPQFRDSWGYSSFALLDTRGLFHRGTSEEENEEYCANLLYRSQIDAIILLQSLSSDTNAKKAQLIYRKILKGFKRDIPIFPVYNRADCKVDDLLKDSEDDGKAPPKSGELQALLATQVQALSEGLANGIARPQQWKTPLICYLKGARSFTEYPDLKERYTLEVVLGNCFAQMSQALRQRAERLPIKLEDWETEPTPKVDRVRLTAIVDDILNLSETDRKVFTPAKLNLDENRWKVPHGNSYNALRRRLAYGGGWSSNILENYYYHCQNIQVNFPAQLQNFVTPTLTQRLAEEALSIQYGTFLSKEDEAAYQAQVARAIQPERFASQLLYDRALMDAERVPGSFGVWFQRFIENSTHYLKQPLQGREDYDVVLEELLTDAARLVLHRKVRYVSET